MKSISIDRMAFYPLSGLQAIAGYELGLSAIHRSYTKVQWEAIALYAKERFESWHGTPFLDALNRVQKEFNFQSSPFGLGSKPEATTAEFVAYCGVAYASLRRAHEYVFGPHDFDKEPEALKPLSVLEEILAGIPVEGAPPISHGELHKKVGNVFIREGRGHYIARLTEQGLFLDNALHASV